MLKYLLMIKNVATDRCWGEASSPIEICKNNNSLHIWRGVFIFKRMKGRQEQLGGGLGFFLPPPPLIFVDLFFIIFCHATQSPVKSAYFYRT